ncbi:MAG TPA: lipopolysaccharide heptosyltransferase I [Nevskiaceae bacterium]|nr:lipopolysaccharide heptosyltransferase I [Nevskiaceae bacterium]
MAVRVLVVKTSSLGDVIHALPALTDAKSALPDVTCDWVVEKAFSEIPAWHPAVGRVVTCELRRWRKHPLAALRSGEWRNFVGELRRTRYDVVLDAQGLLKSAWLATRARGTRIGPGFASAREPFAAMFYDRRIGLPSHDQAHAVDRMRRLFAAALGYAVPDRPPDFGLRREGFPVSDMPPRYAVLLHATTWATKRWREDCWQELGAWLRSQGIACLLPWGNDEERQAAERIAVPFEGRVLPRMRLGEIAGVLAHARFVVGVDTGLAHLAGALGTPSVTLYGPTIPALTGTVGAHQVHLVSTNDPQIRRDRSNTVSVTAVEQALKPWLSTATVVIGAPT